ncbi:sensor histidine kinase [Azospirillum soli]|uniref:sensor histidine kinase n=1 Tax=Azospirillum soli TaxID=1304799 RepID=UPI001AE9514A|nr:ATP-binding protein [Azospirillum soli]MBP2313235.1 PAS domain S-box-containing protein [Azospirillum soli]
MAFWAKQRKGGSLAVPVLVAAGLALSAGAFVQMRQASREVEGALLERQAIQLHDALKERIDSHALLLRAMRSPFSGTMPVSREGFADATRPMLPLFPSLRAVGWARRVTAVEAPGLEVEMRLAGLLDFAVRNVAGPPPSAMAPGEDLFVNVLLEPVERASFGFGINIASVPDRVPVLGKSCATGAMVAADALTPPGREGLGRGFILYLPVYRRGAERDDPAQRCAEMAGFLWAVFGVDQLLKEAVDRVRPAHGDVYVLDTVAPEGKRVLSAWSEGGAVVRPPSPAESVLTGVKTFRHDLDVGGLRWQVVLAVPPAPLIARTDYAALAVLAMGILLTLGLAGYTRREAQAKRLLQTEARARAAMARALRESEERFRLALRHSRVAVFSQDRNLRYIWMYNPQTPRPAEVYIGRTHADLYSPEDAAKLDAAKRPVLETGIGSRQEVRVTSLGREQVFDLIVEPLRDDTGVVTGVICASIDITEGVLIREALAEAHAEAESANLAKSRFLAAASHDLRQPFQAMSLFHHILSARLTDPKQQEVAVKLGEALATGNTLLNNLLDTSALESGTVKPRPQSFPFQEIADRLATEIADQATGKGLSLRMVPTSAIVHSDPVLLERMVRNLLVNALRYTVSGRILLGCRRRGGQLAIEVWDTGPGIPADQQQRIFEDFYRCGADQPDAGRGLGLGLSIVRRTAQILGHRVGVRSTVGKGTVFSIAVPLVGDRHNPPEPESEPAVASA